MGQVLFFHFTVRKMNSRKIKECLAQKKKNKDLRMNKYLQILEGLISGGGSAFPWRADWGQSVKLQWQMKAFYGLWSTESRSLSYPLGGPGKMLKLPERQFPQ